MLMTVYSDLERDVPVQPVSLHLLRSQEHLSEQSTPSAVPRSEGLLSSCLLAGLGPVGVVEDCDEGDPCICEELRGTELRYGGEAKADEEDEDAILLPP